VYHPGKGDRVGSGEPLPPAGTRAVWAETEVCRPTKCPECHEPVFFVRHNGGSVWFDALGHPWPKHGCMAATPDLKWIRDRLADEVEPGNRRVVGVITEATVIEPGTSAFFTIACFDGGTVADEFAYTADPREEVGGLVALELSGGNEVKSIQRKSTYDKWKQIDEQRERAERNLERAARDRAKRAARAQATNGGKMWTLAFTKVNKKFRIQFEQVRGDFSIFRTLTPLTLETFADTVTLYVPTTTEYGRGFSITVPASEAPALFGEGQGQRILNR
jgi:hypothetical protein